MNNSYITIIKEKRTVLSRKRVPLNQNECTADFRIGVPFEQNLQATSSITHNFVISNPNSVKLFIAAIDEADRDRTPKQTLPGRQLTNPQEILALMSKRKKQTLEY